MIADSYRVEPLTVDRFNDFVAVVGNSGIGGCWCMYWTCPTSAAWGEGCQGGAQGSNRLAFRHIVEVGPPPGLVAYLENDPVAWCRIMPRSDLPGLANSHYFKTDLSIDGVWSLPCFVVRKPYRGMGITSVLITAAIEFVRTVGGRMLEAYPWETSETKSDSIVFTGLASTFTRAGFEVVQRRADHKPMMRIALDAPTDQGGPFR